jgi:hypothetical protein
MAKQKVLAPYTVKEKKKDKKINNLNIFQKALLDAIKEQDQKLEEPPKPVKWLKPLKESIKPLDEQKDSSLARLAFTLNPGLRLQINQSLAKTEGKYKDINQLLKSKDEKDYISGLDEIRTGIESGSHNLGTSVGRLLFAGTDLVANTDFLEKFDDLMERTNPEDPETWRGSLIEILTTFGVPGTLITKIGARVGKVGQISKAADKMNKHKASKIALRAIKGSGVVGLTDSLVSYEGRPTLFITPESTKGLSRRKKASAEFRNRIKYGFEGTVVGGLFPIVGKGLQLGYKFLGRPVGEPIAKFGLKTINNLTFRPASYLLTAPRLGTKSVSVPNPLSPVVKKTAEKLTGAGNFTVNKIIGPMIANGFTPKKGWSQVPPFEKWRLGDVAKKGPNARLKIADNLIYWLRSYGKAPKDIESVTEKVQLYIKKKARKIDLIYGDIEAQSYKLAKQFEKRYNGNKTSPVGEKYFLDEVESFLRGKIKLNALPKELQTSSNELKNHVESIMKEFAKALPKGKDADDVVKTLYTSLNKDIKNYLLKSFKTFTNPNYVPDEQVVNNAASWLARNVISKNKDYKIAANQTYSRINNINTRYETYGKDLVNKIMAEGRGEGKNPLAILKDIGQNILRNDKYKFLRTGEELPDAIQKLLGAEKNLKSSILFTTTDAVAANAQKRAADFIAKQGLKNGWLFRNEAEAIVKYPKARQVVELPQIGNKLKTELTDMWTSPEFVEMFKGTGGQFNRSVIAAFYRNYILRPKALVQAGKTLYSPTTQVRNVTAGSMFALLNGHIGHNASLTDSIRIVMRDIFKRGKDIDNVSFNNYIEKLIGYGVIDENVVAQELRAIFKNIKAGSIQTEEELAQALLKAPSITEKVARVYAGGDNLWKIYGYEFDKSMLSQSLKSVDEVADFFKHMGDDFSKTDLVSNIPKSLDQALDEAAAYLIRNTYPTYSKVPPVVQGIRNLPIGNFVSFPAEIIRTTSNNLIMGLKMSSHANPEIRQMGIRRLMGASMTLYGIGKGVSETAYYLTGTTEAQWDAYKRAVAAPWDKNKNLVPITSFKNGESAFVNFSYFTPYDMFDDTIDALLANAYEQGINPQSAQSYVFNQLFAEGGAVRELLGPFISEPLGFDRLIDVTTRGGRTAEGFQVYTASDLEQDLGAVIKKSMIHIIDGVKPGIMTTAEKIKMGIEGDLTRSGKAVNLKDELLALFTGTRIVRVDAKKDIQYMASNLNRLRKSIDDTENFYTVEHWKTHTSGEMVDQYRRMLDKDFRLQKNIYMKLQDLKQLDLDDQTIIKLLTEKGVNKKLARNLMRGNYTALDPSDPRFKTKLKIIENYLDKRQKETGYTYDLDRDLIWPRREFNELKRDYDRKEFFPETYNRETKQYEGGYYPERNEFLTDKKGNLVLDDNGDPIKDPNLSQQLLEKIVPKIKEGFKNIINPLGNVMGKAPVSPLPNTPAPRIQTASIKNPITNLTRTESALLSPSEQVIARRT